MFIKLTNSDVFKKKYKQLVELLLIKFKNRICQKFYTIISKKTMHVLPIITE